MSYSHIKVNNLPENQKKIIVNFKKDMEDGYKTTRCFNCKYCYNETDCCFVDIKNQLGINENIELCSLYTRDEEHFKKCKSNFFKVFDFSQKESIE